MSILSRKQQTQKRHKRQRRNLSGTLTRPRLAVFRSNNHIYAQIIDDDAQSNIIGIEFKDKTVAYYYHLKKNSLTNKSKGEAVSSGVYLYKLITPDGIIVRQLTLIR